MEGSEKWISPSNSTANPKPSSTGEHDENEMTPKFQNQKKTPYKHFMSPTVSASSKFAPRRQKILSEINENAMSPRNRDTDFSANSFKAYDPVKNYLSPRPKYLRFNPNRRNEIFSRLEKEELSDSLDSQEVSGDEINFSRRKESETKNGDNNNADEDENNICDDYEEEEEDIEERGWCFRGLIKLVLTLIACVLSTSYICTMNSTTPTSGQLAIGKVKDGCLVIKRRALDVIGVKMHEFLEMEVRDYRDDELEEGGFKDAFPTDEIEEEKIREIEETVDVEVVENDVKILRSVGTGENEHINNEVEVENLENAEMDKVENRDIEGTVQVFEKVDNELVENVSAMNDCEIDNVAENEGAINDASIVCLDKKMEPSVREIDYVKVSYEQSRGSKTDGSEKAGQVESDIEIEDSHEKQPNSVENEKTGRNISAFIGFGLVSMIFASWAVVVCRMKKKSRNVKALPLLKQRELEAVEEKKKMKIEFIARAPLSHSFQEVPKKLDHDRIHAPTVELIGEFFLENAGRKQQAKSKESNDDFLPRFGTLIEPVLASSPMFGDEYADIFKKEGQNGESMVEVTPVRRSSRLRSRAAVMTP